MNPRPLRFPEHGPIVVGDFVQHSNTKQWGEVLEVVPQRDGTSELLIKFHVSKPWHHEGTSCWASYHTGDIRTAEEFHKGTTCNAI